MKIDIVITWVDPHNQEWLTEKEHWYKKIKGMQYNSVSNYSSYDS